MSARYRIEREDDGAYALWDDHLEVKVGHYYESRRFVARIVAIYLSSPGITATQAWGIAKTHVHRP